MMKTRSVHLISLIKEALWFPCDVLCLALLWFTHASKGKRILIIALKTGRLGNQLRLFSNVLSFAEENNWLLFNPSFYENKKYFDCLSTQRAINRYTYHIVEHAAIRFKKFLNWKFVTTIELENRQVMKMDSPYFEERTSDASIVFLRGFRFEADPYLHKHHPLIDNTFRPHPKYVSEIERPLKALRSKCDRIVGVLIRHGDYRTWSGGKYYFSGETYAQYMNQAKHRFPQERVGFLIVSDENQNLEIFKDFDFEFRSGEAIEDMYSLSGCDYILSPPSTFSAWSSFYGNTPIQWIESAVTI